MIDEFVDAAIKEVLSNLHTATVGKVVSVNDNNTVSVKPVINRLIESESVELPMFTDVPVFVNQGGTSYMTFPIAVGDYALLIFSERCIDGWWSGNDLQPPTEYRMHDYSDGFAFVGFNPLSGLRPTSPDIHIQGDVTHIGNMVHNGHTTHTGNTTQTGNHTQTGDLTLTGNLVVDGNISCTGTLTVAAATIGGIDFATHTHGGVQAGIDNTGVAQ